jgi:site-specific recombinase XerD
MNKIPEFIAYAKLTKNLSQRSLKAYEYDLEQFKNYLNNIFELHYSIMKCKI